MRQLLRRRRAQPVRERQEVAVHPAPGGPPERHHLDDRAGEIDPSVAEATARALGGARVRRTDYGPDGSAKVRVEINLRNLWDELNR